MAVFRVYKNDNYTVMSNTHLKDKNMSLKAKGLLSVILSLPESWDYSINGLVAICKENVTAVRSALDELKELGYLKVTKKMPNETESGRIEYIYDIFENPIEKQDTEKQGIENLHVESQGIENHTQLNTKESNTNKLNTKKLNKDNIREKRSTRFIPPTVEEVRDYCNERNNNIDAENFVDYYESKGWMIGRNKMKDWKASVRTWERNGYSKPKNKVGSNGIRLAENRDDSLDDIF